jgi:hypothetical protein
VTFPDLIVRVNQGTKREKQVAIGILTFHHTGNYGGALQAYATCRELRALGTDAEIIDYRPWSTHARAIKGTLDPSRILFGSPKVGHSSPTSLSAVYLDQCRRVSRINGWLKDEGVLSSRVVFSKSHLKTYCAGYRSIITGSDEVLKTEGKGRKGLTYYLDFTNPGQARVSFAASAGDQTSFGNATDSIKNELSEFLAISVRDSNAQRLIFELLGTPPVILADPTFFLLDWVRTIPAIEGQPPYLTMLGKHTSKYGALMKELASRLGLRLVALGDYCPHADKNFLSPTPAEWVSWIKGSSVVITSLFHGAIFSAMAGTNFYVLTPPEKKLKLGELLKVFGAEERQLSAEDLTAFNPLQKPNERPNFDRVIRGQADVGRHWLRSHVCA